MTGSIDSICARAQVHGYSTAFLVAAAIAIGCSAFALIFIRRRRGEKLVLTPSPEPGG